MASHGDILSAHRFIVDLLDERDQSVDVRALLGRARVRLEQLIDLSLAATTAWKMRDEMLAAELPSHALEFEIAHQHARFLLGEPIDVVGLWRLGEPIVDAVDYLSSSWMALEALTWSGVDDALAHQAFDRFERAACSAGAAQSIVKLHDFRGNLLIRRGSWREGEAELRIAADEADLTEMPGDMSRSALARCWPRPDISTRPRRPRCGAQPQPAGMNSHSWSQFTNPVSASSISAPTATKQP